MSIAGRLLLGLSTLSTLWCTAGLAGAQAAPAPGSSARPHKQQPLILTREANEFGMGNRARDKARAGDCKAALDMYDMALRTSIDPTLHRDRGLCHEQLAQVFPAIDDYRAYLKDRPQAPDSDQIRERLMRLEEQQGLSIRTSDHADHPSAKPDSDGASASASVSLNGEGVSADASSGGSGRKSGSQADYERDEKLAAAASGSPLRESGGWALGPYLGIRSSGDVTSKLGDVQGKQKLGVNEVAGGTVRYSLGKVSSILGEIGYVGFNSNNISGTGFFLGYEARVALSRWTSDALIVGVGLGYERYRASDTGGILNNVMPRARLGYRHVFGDALGLEFTGDGGIAKYFLNDAPPGFSFSLTPVFGGYVAVVVGF